MNKELLTKVFVNREEETALLVNIFKEVCNARGKFLIINGEEGSGKTALVSHVKDYITRNNGRFAELAFTPAGGFSPYEPFISLLEKLDEQNPDHERKFDSNSNPKTFNSNHDNSVIDLEALYSIQSNYQLIQQKILTKLLDYASDKPLVVAIKDAHFASLSAWQFFHFIADKIRDNKILFIATLRQDGKESLEENQPVYADIIRRMNRDGFVKKISLSRFTEAETRRLFLQIFKKTDFSGDFLPTIYEVSGGLPAKIIRYIDQLLKSKKIYQKNDIWFNLKDIDKNTLINDAIDHVDALALEKEFRQLTGNQQQLLKYAALIDDDFDYILLASVINQTKINTLRELKKLTESKIVISAGETKYKFKRPEFKSTIIQSLSVDEKEQLHLKLADTIENSDLSSGNQSVYLIAYHYNKSSQKVKGFPHLITAGDLAIFNFAFAEAKLFYQEALKLLDNPECPASNSEIVHLYIQASWLNRILGNYKESLFYAEQAITTHGKKKFDRTSILIHLQQSFTYFRLNDWKNAKESIEICLHNLDSLKPFEKSMTHYSMGNIYFELSKYTEARDYYGSAKKFAEEANAKTFIALVLNNLGSVENVCGNTMKAIALYSQAIPIYKELNNKTGLAQVYNNIGLTYAEESNWNQANEFYGKSLSVTGMMDLSPLKSITFLNRAMALTKLNKIEEAREYSFKAIRLIKLLNDELGMAEYNKIMGIIETIENNESASEKHFNEALKIFKQFENRLGYAETLYEMGANEIKNKNQQSALLKLTEAHKIFKELQASKKLQSTNDLINECKLHELVT